MLPNPKQFEKFAKLASVAKKYELLKLKFKVNSVLLKGSPPPHFSFVDIIQEDSLPIFKIYGNFLEESSPSDSLSRIAWYLMLFVYVSLILGKLVMGNTTYELFAGKDETSNTTITLKWGIPIGIYREILLQGNQKQTDIPKSHHG